MRDEAEPRAFLNALWRDEALGGPGDENWPGVVARIERGGNQRVSREACRHFPEVLPPRCHGGDSFASREGAEPLEVFTRSGGAFACRQLTWDQTVTFCELAGIDLPD